MATKVLPILWRRLVVDGQTCPRCGNTEGELEQAVATLRVALRPLGIEPELTAVEITEDAFQAKPTESNRIWIAGKPLEDWLDAKAGESTCCSVCGQASCRTVEAESGTFEVVPDRLILKAALLAAADLV